MTPWEPLLRWGTMPSFNDWQNWARKRRRHSKNLTGWYFSSTRGNCLLSLCGEGSDQPSWCICALGQCGSKLSPFTSPKSHACVQYCGTVRLISWVIGEPELGLATSRWPAAVSGPLVAK